MTRYLVRRLALMIPVAVLASVILFVLLKLTPGDPVLIMLGERATAQNYEAIRRELGLDQPYPIQYLRWASHVVQGDLGKSLRNGAPVRDEIVERLPATFQLGIVALLIALVVAVPLGILSAVFRRSALGLGATAFTQVGVALPGFFIGLVLIYVFALRLRWFPPGSYTMFTDNPGEWFRRIILPAITLSLFGAATQTRFIRSGLLETLHQDYIRTARAKGFAESAVILRHALRNALIPSVTLLGLQVGAILEGAFIVESVFAWPGVGRLAVQALGARDYPTVQAVVLLAVFVFLLANLIVDIAYAYLDPRISFARRGGA
ncbi:MAG: ABC transporter permease [Chloroflexota bacterium]|nr:ABC transporter permease [Chloroflexota bacterium]